MGRGGDKAQMQLDDVERIAPDIIRDEEAERARRFELALRRALGSGGSHLDALDEMLENSYFRSRLIEEQAESRYVDYLFDGVIKEALEYHPGDLEDGSAIRFALSAYAVAPSHTPLIVLFSRDREGLYSHPRHLRESEAATVTLCGKHSVPDLAPGLPHPLRGVFSMFPNACPDCAALAAARPAHDPVRVAAEEGRDYLACPEQAELIANLRARAVSALKEAIAASNGGDLDAEKIIYERVIGDLNVIGAERFDKLPIQARLDNLFQAAGDQQERDLLRSMRWHLLDNYDDPAAVEWPLVFTVQRMYDVLADRKVSVAMARAILAAHILALAYPEAAKSFYGEFWSSSEPCFKEITDLLGFRYPRLIRGDE